MRPKISVFLATLLITATLAFAQATTQPTTQAPRTILILPFASPESGNYQWTGQAVQQVIATDLSRSGVGMVIAPAKTAPAPDLDAAIQAGRDANASAVVFGQAQATADEIRVTGQVVDVASQQPLGSLKATAKADELFTLEDTVAGQTLALLQDAGYAPTTGPSVTYMPYPNYSIPDYVYIYTPLYRYSYPYYAYPHFWPYRYRVAHFPVSVPVRPFGFDHPHNHVFVPGVAPRMTAPPRGVSPGAGRMNGTR